jgi:hypothetical protein
MSTTTTSYSSGSSSLPIGVAILAILIGIYGFIVFLIGLFITVGSTLFAGFGTGNFAHALGVSGVIAGLVILIIGLIILGLAVGLWNLRMWALALTIIVLVIEMILYALAGAYITFGFIVALILVVYLIAVSRHFS